MTVLAWSFCAQPILAFELMDATKLALVISHQNVTQLDRLGGNEEIVCAERCSNLFKLHAKQTVGSISRGPQRQNIHYPEYRF